ncbi:methylated-DNA--[protein]-cysteine S-methyltransferase [Paenibacillus aurantius]|uniref:Methylated-DNA--protein-cysteine methyltransferase n=1 Tax=Paenibacillus aurantius TaxID=2918900 RepID=A0AA96LL76_9BACL|nr:methylated-DNA--[protein]-cysteine S-methyltransferase [Paenibacillus aurantius]WNQ14146.1 methylated-DNA--[protein]-cysteine S-methyltransferase [Paenibacillus aurantius]
MYYDEIETPIGPLVLCAGEEGLCRIEFGSFRRGEPFLEAWSRKYTGADRLVRDDRFLQPAVDQLQQYFAGERTAFDLPIQLYGSDFQVKVWRALTGIPYGETRSYKEIGEVIGAPKAVRAVGGANNRNPLPIVVPCHRVIGSNGAMVGYGGGLAIKEQLLGLEGYAQVTA